MEFRFQIVLDSRRFKNNFIECARICLIQSPVNLPMFRISNFRIKSSDMDASGCSMLFDVLVPTLILRGNNVSASSLHCRVYMMLSSHDVDRPASLDRKKETARACNLHELSVVESELHSVMFTPLHQLITCDHLAIWKEKFTNYQQFWRNNREHPVLISELLRFLLLPAKVERERGRQYGKELICPLRSHLTCWHSHGHGPI